MTVNNFQVETSEAGYNVRCKKNLATGTEEYFMIGMIPSPLPLPNGTMTVVLKEQEFPLEGVASFNEVVPAIEKLIEDAVKEMNKPQIITPGNSGGGLTLVN